MKERSFASFRELAEVLEADVDKTFLHRWQNPPYSSTLPESWRKQLPQNWDIPGQSGAAEAPKYLYRGEPNRYASSLSSRGRLNSGGRFTADEVKLLDQLTKMAVEVWNLRTEDRFRSLGWPQHYGFPTTMLDITVDPRVALHFAAWAAGEAEAHQPVVYRLDLEAIEHKVYGAAGEYTALSAGSIEHINCTRATRQRAWMIRSNDDEPWNFDFQSSEHLLPHIEKFTVDASDADSFVQPGLLDAQDDGFASWPLAIVRGFKAEIQAPLSRNMAEWICRRIPLFEWTPVEAVYDSRGRGTRLRLLSPSEGTLRDGRDYRADFQTVVDELSSPEIPTPNGIVFGLRTGGRAGTSEWLEPGQEYEFQWRYPFPGPGRWGLPYVFEKLKLA
jgi:hypothetical protein